MTASRSPRPTSNAPSNCCRARRRKSCASTRARSWFDNVVGGHDQRRLRGHLSPEAAAAVAAGDAGDRLDADLSLPRLAGADAAASDRHRAVQIRRVQAEPVDHGGAQPGLLETGPALSRRHRIPRSSRTSRPGCCPSSPARGRVFRRDDAAVEGRQEPDAAGDLRHVPVRMSPAT